MWRRQLVKIVSTSKYRVIELSYCCMNKEYMKQGQCESEALGIFCAREM